MMSLRFWTRILCVAALFAVVPAAGAQDVPLSLDDEYAQMAERVHGFGGLYLDERGTTHVYLQDVTRAGEMQGLGDRVVFQQGDYDFRDLQAWKDQVRPELAAEGAVYLDIDERRNRLVFGVEREAIERFTEELQRFLGGTRVPPAAVIVEAAEPIRPAALLTDTTRPVPAGVQISNASGLCTLGTNAVRAGVKGFITASHCTNTRSVVDGTIFFQSTFVAGNAIGVETVDPPFFTGGSCPPGRVCRRSDTAFAAYSTTSFSEGPKIANPLFWGTSSGTLQISLVAPRLTVAGALFGSLTSGSVVYKVGRTTGGTLGSVTNTCIDSNVLGSTVTMLCQERVAAAGSFGDSGSPVFIQSGGVATLAGILWGVGGNSYVYSSWGSVFSELGGPNPAAP